MTIQPASTNILCQIIDAKEAGNILLPESVKPLVPYGKVLALGPLVSTVKLGDKIIFPAQFAKGVNESERLVLIQEGMIEAFYVDDVSLES